MEQRRIAFFALAMTLWLAWFHIVGPMLLPDAFPKPRQPGAQVRDVVDSAAGSFPADALIPVNGASAPKVPQVAAFPQHPPKTLQLGPADLNKGRKDENKAPAADFFLAASLTSQGAAIDFMELTDKKRYPAFGHRGERVRVLGSDSLTPLRTFALRSPAIDKFLDDSSLAQVSWEVVPEPDLAAAERAATFRFVSPDNQWQITKRFELRQLTDEELQNHEIHKELLEGYEVRLKITVRNLTDQAQEFKYELQGPVGVPLEDAENTNKYRDVRMGFLRDDGKIDESRLSATETVKKEKNDKTQDWKTKLKYVGVDVLYFAALVLPDPANVESAKAIIVNESRSRTEFSDISVVLTSPMQVAGNSEVSHEYTLFAGPKRKDLIAKIPAMAVMDYGWFDTICRGMVWLLNMFHDHLGFSYGIAIIGLTALVRTLLLPISKYVAANQAKMKVLQPKIMAKQKELEAKYGKNTEEYMKAAQELSKEQLGLMMSGCLPVFLQIPIFFALYRTIGSSIELRMEPFLWFENLASPDALFELPFVVPWMGWTHFNLLPCISTGLMYVSSKLTMPPPTNEEQAQQQKMMSYMMVIMGAMFFRVPSGLCIYIITTNIWSMTERWLFEHLKKNVPTDIATGTENKNQLALNSGSSSKSPGNTVKPEDAKPSALGGIWNRLQEAADTQRTASRQLDNSGANRNDKKKKRR